MNLFSIVKISFRSSNLMYVCRAIIYSENMIQFVECQFTFEDLRDCALLRDDTNTKNCDICKRHIGEICDQVD